jgi:hypothetical protein
MYHQEERTGLMDAAAQFGFSLDACLHTEAHWKDSEDIDWPWIAAVGKAVWRLRLNDFPEEPMYTLFVDGNEVGDFNDWPELWQR